MANIRAVATVLILLAPVLWAQAAAAQEILRAVTAMPPAIDHTQSFRRFVDKVNEAGAGIVQIRIVGGPEVIPPMEQADALRRGVIDMQHGPSSYYLGLVPEGDALVGARFTAPELRAKGAYDLLDPIYHDRINARILGHFDSGVQFHIYLKQVPEIGPSGLSLRGVKLRSQPIYRAFFVSLGATPVSVPVSDAYSAFARGVVDGTGWIETGLTDLSWHDHLRVRIDPAFFQTDVLAIVNAERWDRLPPQARTVLSEVAKAHEQSSIAYFRDLIESEEAALLAGGMEVVELDGEARRAYLDMAYDAPWSRLEKNAPAHYERLRAVFFEGEAYGAAE